MSGASAFRAQQRGKSARSSVLAIARNAAILGYSSSGSGWGAGDGGSGGGRGVGATFRGELVKPRREPDTAR